MVKRRASSKGDIRKWKNGCWADRCTAAYDPTSGKWITKNVLSKPQAEVKKKSAKAITGSQQLDVPKMNRYTVATWLIT